MINSDEAINQGNSYFKRHCNKWVRYVCSPSTVYGRDHLKPTSIVHDGGNIVIRFKQSSYITGTCYQFNKRNL